MGNVTDLGCANEVVIVNMTQVKLDYQETLKNSTAGGASSGNLIWIAGAACAVISAATVALGTLIQKLALNKNEVLPDEKKAKMVFGLLMSKLWLFGFLTMVVFQFPLSIVAFSLAPQSIIVPLGAGSTIVFDQLFAPCLLGEKLGRMEILATFIIVGGIALTTSSSIGAATPVLTPCQLIARYTATEVVIITAVLVAIVFMMMLLIHVSKFRPRSLNVFIPVFYAFVAGGWGAIMNATLKAVGEIIESAGVADINPWSTIIPYIQIIFCIVVAVLMISYINQGLGHFDAVVFLPLYNCLYIVLSSTYGGIFYLEFAGMTDLGLILFSAGIATTFVGVGLLSLRGHKIETVYDFTLSVRELPIQLASAGDVDIEALPPSPEERRKAFLKSTEKRGWILQDEHLIFLGGSIQGYHHDVGKKRNRLKGVVNAVAAAGSGAAQAVVAVGSGAAYAVVAAGGNAVQTVANAGSGAAYAMASAGQKLVSKKDRRGSGAESGLHASSTNGTKIAAASEEDNA